IGRWPNLDRSWGSGDLLKFRQTDLERLVHGDNLHTHLHGQRMCRDVVWALRRSAGGFTQIRIDLFLHHCFGECTKWLGHTDDVAALRILNAIGCECCFSLFHFNFPKSQNVEHLDGCDGITLIGWNDKRVWRAVPGNRSLLHRIKVAQPTFAVISHVLQSAHRRRHLVIDDVAQMPLSPTPKRGKLPTDGPRIVTETGTQVAEVLLDG